MKIGINVSLSEDANETLTNTTTDDPDGRRLSHIRGEPLAGGHFSTRQAFWQHVRGRAQYRGSAATSIVTFGEYSTQQMVTTAMNFRDPSLLCTCASFHGRKMIVRVVRFFSNRFIFRRTIMIRYWACAVTEPALQLSVPTTFAPIFPADGRDPLEEIFNAGLNVPIRWCWDEGCPRGGGSGCMVTDIIGPSHSTRPSYGTPALHPAL